MRRRVAWRSLALALTAAAAVIGNNVAAAEERPARSTDRQVEVAGVQVAIDAETGRLRQPTPEEARELMRGLAELMQQRATRSEATKHADGSVSVVLGADTLSIALARLNGDNSVAQACIDSVEQANQFLLGASALEDK